jgi:hypothetical protein
MMFTCSGDPEIEEKLAGLNAEVAKRISAARAEGYREGERKGAVKALDDAKKALDLYWRPSLNGKTPWDIIDQLKSAYEKGTGDGKAE